MMDRPIDVPTRETVAFLSSHLAPGAAVLEVGCGQGHVAVALAQRGYRVTAVDSEPEIVAAALARGAHAFHATWPDFETAPVDAVAFTRSLHHIGSLSAAIRKARDVLKPGGKLLLEDFAFDQASPATIRWFVGTLRSLAALITPAESRFVAALLAADNPIAIWREHHDHDLHTIDAMTRVIADHLGVLETSSIPYLYRYLVPVRPGTPEGKASFRRRCWGPKQRVPTTSSSFASKIGSGVASPERVATEPQAGRWRGRNRCRQEFDRGKVRETCHHGHRSR